MNDWRQLERRTCGAWFAELHRQLRRGELTLGRYNYSAALALGVQVAINSGVESIAAVEMGVAGGDGLLALCSAASHFREALGFDVRVYGFDNATGLPPLVGHRDHPELWRQGEFLMRDEASLRAKLPDFAELFIGDVAETIDAFRAVLVRHPLGFVAIDVDLYSSTTSCFRMLEWEAECYLPAVPFYFDDMVDYITYNDWCGEQLAVAEFNAAHELRKFQRQPDSNISNLSILNVLDHPLRTGARRPRFPLRIGTVSSRPPRMRTGDWRGT
jgi:hypothetical protein